MSVFFGAVARAERKGMSTAVERAGAWPRCALFLVALQWAACGGGSGSASSVNQPSGADSSSQTSGAAATGTGTQPKSGGASGSTAGTSAPARPRDTASAGVGASAAPAMSATPASNDTAQASTAGATAAQSGMTASLSGAPGGAAGAAGTAGQMAAVDMSGMLSMSSSDEPMPSAGCMSGTLKPGRQDGSIQSSGGNRTYIQYIPASYDGKTPVPLVVDLHPFSVGATFAESSSGFRQLADTEGYMYLAPQGMSNMWDSVGDTDEKFIRDLVNDVAANGCIDLRRVYATGCSNGGAFSFLLMCTAEDIFAAVAPMCGTAFFDIENMCMMDRPVSFMLRIGKQDTLNCWEGEGMVLDAPNVPAGTRVQCAKTVQKVFSEKYHCKGQIMMKDECEYVGDCDEGTQIAICDENTGHVVYTANTARDTWAFLKQFYKH